MSRASCYESLAQRRLRLRCLVLYSEKVKTNHLAHCRKTDHDADVNYDDAIHEDADTER